MLLKVEKNVYKYGTNKYFISSDPNDEAIRHCDTFKDNVYLEFYINTHGYIHIYCLCVAKYIYKNTYREGNTIN